VGRGELSFGQVAFDYSFLIFLLGLLWFKEEKTSCGTQ
jgi:hypothetical protein